MLTSPHRDRVKAIGAALEPFAFDTIHSHHFDRFIAADGKRALQASVERYLAALGGAFEQG